MFYVLRLTKATIAYGRPIIKKWNNELLYIVQNLDMLFY
ncbi:protein of unknown function [Legionella fallonii LLAP-10]|uniref:Uncharacterized protein n=1 Tax=Legionella fallonii LLAP-10 TaxID=1212491 RepID=A0A098FZQ1_9GAMM|nr:protein of unknown function [Legionella fallonii LLAP-10]